MLIACAFVFGMCGAGLGGGWLRSCGAAAGGVEWISAALCGAERDGLTWWMVRCLARAVGMRCEQICLF